MVNMHRISSVCSVHLFIFWNSLSSLKIYVTQTIADAKQNISLFYHKLKKKKKKSIKPMSIINKN